MKLKLISVLITMMMLFVALSGAEEIKSIHIIDDSGRDISIEKVPERIVSLSPANTEILFALGLESKIVGVTQYCNYPAEVEGLKKNETLTIVGGFKNPDIEKILTLHPDLVLASKIHLSETVPELQKIGILTFVAKPNNLSSILLSVKKIGKITGTDAEAINLTSRMESRIEAVSDKVGQLPKKRVFYAVWGDPIKTAGAGTFEDEIIETAGGLNIFHDLSGYAQVDTEAIAVRNPEVIITCTGMGDGMDKPFLWAKTDNILNQSEARLNDRIYQADGNLITRAGPRIVDGLEMFAKFIHPEAFGKA